MIVNHFNLLGIFSASLSFSLSVNPHPGNPVSQGQLKIAHINYNINTTTIHIKLTHSCVFSYLFPLVDVANESREAQESQQTEDLCEADNPQRTRCLVEI